MTQVIAGGSYLERSVSPGEIAVFEPTGRVLDHVEMYTVRGGDRAKVVTAREFARTRTRIIR